MFSRRFAHIFLIIISIWVLYLFFSGIRSLSLENWDEAFYADTIRSMVQNKRIILPLWNAEPFLDKPPLYFWLGSLSTYFFGLTELSYRLPSVLSSIAIIFLVAKYVYKKYGYFLMFIPVLWLSSDLIFLSRGRGGNLDTLATLFIFISYLILISKNKHKYFYWGLVAGLVYLTKASLSFYLFIILFVEILFNSHDLKRKCFDGLSAVGVYIVTLLIWIIPLYFTEGLTTVKYFLFSSDQGVAHLSIFNISVEYLYFLRESLSSIFLLPSYIGFVFMAQHFKKNLVFFLYSFVLLILLLMSPIHYNWYLIPIFPFWAVSSTFFFKKVLEALKKEYVEIGLLTILGALIFQHVQIFNRSLHEIINSRSTYNQARAAEFASKYRKDGAIFVRIDNNYPVAVYYSKGRVLVSPQNWTQNEGFFLTRAKLQQLLEKKSKVILMGTKTDMEEVKKLYPNLRQLQRDGDEIIVSN